MTLDELVAEFMSVRVAGGLVLDDDEVLECALVATRYYAAWGDIRSISRSDSLPGAAGPGAAIPAPLDPEPDVLPALPIKDLELIDQDTDLTVGEWGIISPLFKLHVERENAMRLEASRGLGTDPYGRSVSEVASAIEQAEERVQQQAFQSAIITV